MNMIKVTEKMMLAFDSKWQEFEEDEFEEDPSLVESVKKIAFEDFLYASEEIQELIKCQECLKELVYLKMYKEKKGEDKFYKDTKNIAWHNAKKLMIKADVQPPKEQNND